jgi:hypothetical protein
MAQTQTKPPTSVVPAETLPDVAQPADAEPSRLGDYASPVSEAEAAATGRVATGRARVSEAEAAATGRVATGRARAAATGGAAAPPAPEASAPPLLSMGGEGRAAEVEELRNLLLQLLRGQEEMKELLGQILGRRPSS